MEEQEKNMVQNESLGETEVPVEKPNDAQAKSEPKTEIIEINSKTSIFRYFLGAMIVFGVCFISCVFIFQIVFLQVGVEGRSMQPTINASAIGENYDIRTDTVFCFRTNNVKYKDIVIIDKLLGNEEEKIIKRVIGEPGQTVTFKRDSTESPDNFHTYILYSVFVNGQKLEEDYINEQPKIQLGDTSNSSSIYNNFVSSLRVFGSYSVTLGEDEFFVMGDNRNHSTDSRAFGAVKRSEIVGKVVLQIKYGQTLFGALISTIF